MKSKILLLISYVACLETCYNLWNLLSTWLFLLINMMTTAGNSSSNAASNADNDNNVFTANLNTCMNSTDDNLCDYFLFNMHLVSNYMNNQLIYYYISDAISAAEQAHFQQLMKQHKTSLEMLEWNSMSDNESSTSEESVISVIENSNFNCSAFLPDYKSIKINTSDISKLTYNNMIIQYNNWLADVKTDFDENFIKFFISCQKIILISIIFDKQLKMILNNVMQNNSDLSYHWQKFKYWLQDVVFHDNFDKLKLSKKFITVH